MTKTMQHNKTATSQSSASSRNRRIAWEWFEQHGYKEHRGLTLHHIDTTMKARDPERYNEWRPEDLQPLTRQEHRRLHMRQQTKGIKHTAQHNKKISDGIKNSLTKGKIVKIHCSPIEEQTLYFRTLAQAADFIGCTRQLVSQCLSTSSNNKKAMGWDISLVDPEDVEPELADIDSILEAAMTSGKTANEILADLKSIWRLA